jgi:hypothetical protein
VWCWCWEGEGPTEIALLCVDVNDPVVHRPPRDFPCEAHGLLPHCGVCPRLEPFRVHAASCASVSEWSVPEAGHDIFGNDAACVSLERIA